MNRTQPLQRRSPFGREGMRSAALRRATAPGDFLDDAGRPIPGTIPRPRPKEKRKRKVEPSPAFTRNQGPCALCPKRRRNQRRRQAHHVLPQQFIRHYVEGLRLPEAEERRLLRKLLSDKRNRMWLCAGIDGCHDRFEHGTLRIFRHQTPASAWEFARELGERYVARLERMYPLDESPA